MDTVLRFERQLDKTFPPDKKYTTEKRGKRDVKDYSVEYSKAYQKMMRGMVERRMRASILDVGSYWYSAWVDAGQPDLNKLIAQPLAGDELKKVQHEEALYKVGKVVH